MRRIDQLYNQQQKLFAKIAALQEKCKHTKKIKKYIICIPGSSGDHIVCAKCDKMIERCVDNISVSMTINSPYIEYDVRNSDGLELYEKS